MFPFTCIGTKTHDLKYAGGDPGLRIGDRNVFREYVSVHGATKAGEFTVLGDDNVLLAYAHVAHDCIIGNHLVMSAQAALAGHVIVEDHINIGWGSGRAPVLPHRRARDARGDVEDRAGRAAVHHRRRQRRHRALDQQGRARAARVHPRAARFDQERLPAFLPFGYNRTQAFEHMRTSKYAQSADFQHFLNFVTKSERGVVAGK